jgi:hypothetical protein
MKAKYYKNAYNTVVANYWTVVVSFLSLAMVRFSLKSLRSFYEDDISAFFFMISKHSLTHMCCTVKIRVSDTIVRSTISVKHVINNSPF